MVFTESISFVWAENADTDEAAENTPILAFPGAEGLGAYASGGRGGEVYEVTNLNDSGPGSFRDAVSQSNRTIVFRVSGTIYLKNSITIKSDNLTIAGQTAPGEGITIAGYPVLFNDADNVIVRYIRFRLGDENVPTTNESDAVDVNYCDNFIMDHCSMSWGIDENISLYDNRNLTVQWCMITEGLNYRNHSCGGLWGPNSSYHHNLFAHNKTRNPKIAYLEDSTTDYMDVLDFRNNVIYDWGNESIYTGTQGHVNIVNNYFKPGPSTTGNFTTIVDADPTNTLYVSGNYMYGSEEVTNNNWLGVKNSPIKSDTPFEVPYVETHSAETAYRLVLAEAGASLVRDSVDERIVNDVINGTGAIIYSQNDVGGYPELKSATPPTDSDHDGMPDEWELENGLDPYDPEDRNGDLDGDGYTNLEEYLNSLTTNGLHKPIVTLYGPEANTILPEGSDIEISADVFDDGVVTKVEFYNGDTLLSKRTSAPYSYRIKKAADGTYNLYVKAYDDMGLCTTSKVIPVHVNTKDNTLPWISRDIGSVSIPGSASDEKNIITVKGSGEIGGSSDTYHYLFQKLNGNGSMVAKIESDTLLANGGDTGIMIRESLSTDSKTIMLAISYEKGEAVNSQRTATFKVRAETGGFMTSTDIDLPSFPVYLKLERVDNTFSAYVSKDGKTWNLAASQEVEIKPDVYIGLASGAAESTSGIPEYNTARYSNVKLMGIIPPVIFIDQADAITNNPKFTLTGTANKKAKVATIVNGEEINKKMISHDLTYESKINLVEGENTITAQAYLTQVVVFGRVVAEVPSDAKLKLDKGNEKAKKGKNKIKLKDEETGETLDLEFNIDNGQNFDLDFGFDSDFNLDSVNPNWTSPIEIRRISSEQSIKVILDTVAPVINPSETSATINKSYYILSGTVSEACTLTASVNGAKPVEIPVDENLSFSSGFGLELGSNTILLQAVDLAGNVSDSTVVTVMVIDETAPTVEYPETISQEESYIIEVTDDLSGISSCTITIDGKTYSNTDIANIILPIGQYYTTIVAVDNAGNKTTVNYTLTVKGYIDTLYKVIEKAYKIGLINGEDVKDLLLAKANQILIDKFNVTAALPDLDAFELEINAQKQNLEPDFAEVLLRDISYLRAIYESGNYWDLVANISLKFDFGSGTLAEGYTKVTKSTLYTPLLGYGLVGEQFDERSRSKSSDPLLMDFVFSNYKKDNKWYYQFWVDLPNGNYSVTFVTGDRDSDCAAFDVMAEGEPKSQVGSLKKNEFAYRTFEVTVTDGQLNIEFIGSNISRLNGLDIVPLQ